MDQRKLIAPVQAEPFLLPPARVSEQETEPDLQQVPERLLVAGPDLLLAQEQEAPP